jgi:hypothetical protein
VSFGNMLVRATLAGAVLFAAPAIAQSFTADVVAISAGCKSSAGTCRATVLAEIARLRAAGLPPAAVDAQLGIIAGTATSAAQSLPAAQRATLGRTLRDVAEFSSNPAQQQALERLAADLESGNAVDLVAVASSLSAY